MWVVRKKPMQLIDHVQGYVGEFKKTSNHSKDRLDKVRNKANTKSVAIVNSRTAKRMKYRRQGGREDRSANGSEVPAMKVGTTGALPQPNIQKPRYLTMYIS